MRSAAALMLALAFLVLFAFSAGAFEIALQKPEANASAAVGDNAFEFSASGASPLSCELRVDDAPVASGITAYKNLPVIVHANLSAGGSGGSSSAGEQRSWSVKCRDAEGVENESETRLIVFSSVGSSPGFPSVSPPPAVPLPAEAGSLSGFVVTSGGEREEGALLPSWRANPGRRAVLAALFSNDGANALNVSLEVLVFNETLSGLVVASVESENVSVASGEKRVLQAEWTPEAEGAFVVEAHAVAGDGSEFGKAYLQLNVSQAANADWLFLLALACIAVLCIAIFKTRANARAIRGGGLK